MEKNQYFLKVQFLFNIKNKYECSTGPNMIILSFQFIILNIPTRCKGSQKMIDVKMS